MLFFALGDAKVPDARYFAFWWNIGLRRGGGFFPPHSDIGAQQGRGATLKFGRYFSLVGIAKNYFLSPPLDFYHECKEGRWIFST